MQVMKPVLLSILFSQGIAITLLNKETTKPSPEDEVKTEKIKKARNENWQDKEARKRQIEGNPFATPGIPITPPVLIGAPPTIEAVKTGYPVATKLDTKKCFLSKASIFTAAGAGVRYPQGMTMSNLQRLLNGATCHNCLTWLTMDSHERHQAAQSDAKILKECKACWSLWDVAVGKAGLTRDQKDAIFVAQKPLMQSLARELLNHKVSLYLDFEDESAESIVPRGTEWTPKIVAEVQELLRQKVRITDKFLDWQGAGGEFCMVEKAAALQNKKEIIAFHFDPLQRSNPQTNDGLNAGICRTDKDSGEHFATQVCELCGGEHCDKICP